MKSTRRPANWQLNQADGEMVNTSFNMYSVYLITDDVGNVNCVAYSDSFMFGKRMVKLQTLITSLPVRLFPYSIV